MKKGLGPVLFPAEVHAWRISTVLGPHLGVLKTKSNRDEHTLQSVFVTIGFPTTRIEYGLFFM